MADIESIRLANCFDFSQFWSWFQNVQVAPYFFPLYSERRIFQLTHIKNLLMTHYFLALKSNIKMILFVVIFPQQRLSNQNYGVAYATKFLNLSFKCGKNVTKCDHRIFLVIYKASCHTIHHNKTHFHAKQICFQHLQKFSDFILMHHHLHFVCFRS